MRERAAWSISGVVQGVGFRPHVARLAHEFALDGWVRNADGGVIIEAEGERGRLDRFATALRDRAPERARIDRIDRTVTDCSGSDVERRFFIRTASGSSAWREGAHAGGIAADTAPCKACLAELLDPTDRRYRYPFIACTDCGPRYSVVESLPYERAHTTMRHFEPCARCLAEVDSLSDRRFHAQANACADCGPQLSLHDSDGTTITTGDNALTGAVKALRNGAVIALKGAGGYQLLVDAGSTRRVRELRRRKTRPHKPFAVLLADLHAVRSHCLVSPAEGRTLCSNAAPIVLLQRRREATGTYRIARAVAPGTALLGVMLPATPLHHLLAREADRPLVATSANRSGEPMIIDDEVAVSSLDGIADLLLAHDRPIVRALDDSLVRIVDEIVLPLRLGRGHTPLSLAVSELRSGRAPVGDIVALGGQGKASLAWLSGTTLMLGEHLGDLDDAATCRAWDAALDDTLALHRLEPSVVACDTHPDYHATRRATALAPRVTDTPCRTSAVAHHTAHVLACLADNDVSGPALGVAWDGTGHGNDNSVWGGEWLHVDGTSVRHAARLARFRLPGADRAVHDPRRTALGALFAACGCEGVDPLLRGQADAAEATETLGAATQRLLSRFGASERRWLIAMLNEGLHAPETSSAGRLFDAVAVLLDVVRLPSHEGQAAQWLEQLALRADAPAALTRCAILHGPPGDATWIVDWRPMLRSMLAMRASGTTRAALAAGFHVALVDAIVEIARRGAERRVALCGGCFQNVHLLRLATDALESSGFTVLRHRRIPPNDGALAVGQALFASRLNCGEHH